jgi:hypothetical protein
MPRKKKPSKLRLVFLHVPKTGGTTLHHHFSTHFTPEETCPERFSGLDRYSVNELEQWRYFSGHFNTDEIKRIPKPVFVVTVLRNPIERLLSNYYFWKRHTSAYIAQHGLHYVQLTKAGTLSEFLRSTDPTLISNRRNSITLQTAGAVLAQPDGNQLFKGGEAVGWLSDAQLLQQALSNLLSFNLVDDISRLKDVYSTVAQTFGMIPLNDLPSMNTRYEVDDVREPWEEELITPEIQGLLEQSTNLDRVLYELVLNHWQNALTSSGDQALTMRPAAPLTHQPNNHRPARGQQDMAEGHGSRIAQHRNRAA